jgi:cytochrome b561/polyisoprenoid-binding protein YceI
MRSEDMRPADMSSEDMSSEDMAQAQQSAPSRVRRWLHWLIAAAVMTTAVIGLLMTRLDGIIALNAAGLAQRIFLYGLHKTLGLVIAAVVVWRLALVLRAGLLRSGHSPAEVVSARFVAGLLLTALVLLPLTGLVQHMLVRGAAPIWSVPAFEILANDPALSLRFGAAHRTLAWLMLGAIALHIAGALKHHLIDRDDTLRRMLFGGQTTSSPNAVFALAPTASVAPLAGVALGLTAAIAGFLATPAIKQPTITSALPAGSWIMDRSKSRLDIEAVQGSEAFKARFDRFDVRIVLDPARLEQAEITAEIDVASFASGLPDRDTVARDSDWLEAARYPSARYASSQLTKNPDGRYRADGMLRIRDWRAPVTLTFDLVISGDRARARGEAQFDRFDLKLGRGDTGGEDMAGRTIRITLDIHAQRARPIETAK